MMSVDLSIRIFERLGREAVMNYFRYEDIQVGMEQEYCVRITDDMMERFKDITGDCNPLHTDDKFAEAHGYPKRIAYGMLTASFLSTLAGVYLPGEEPYSKRRNKIRKTGIYWGCAAGTWCGS